ncbi:MAG: hypothetical protein L0177_07625 [Chloroflexi bacterium]|nr:hypothetical protein [Chloroflexota bacterium]
MIAIGLGVFVVLSLLVGLFPRLFFVLYAGAGALALLGIALIVLTVRGLFGSIVPGLILLVIAPLVFLYARVVQSIYNWLDGGAQPRWLPSGFGSSIESLNAQSLLDLPIGVWMLIGLAAVNVMGLGKGMKAREVIAMNLGVLFGGFFIAYALGNG